jgi:hypothetical protein
MAPVPVPVSVPAQASVRGLEPEQALAPVPAYPTTVAATSRRRHRRRMR